MNFKALGYGLATFIAGYALMTGVVNELVSAGIYASGYGLVLATGYLVPVVAGFVAAMKAPNRRILHGIVGGAIGIVLVQLISVFVVPSFTSGGALVIVTTFAVMAALGAVLGDYVAKRKAS